MYMYYLHYSQYIGAKVYVSNINIKYRELLKNLVGSTIKVDTIIYYLVY